MNRKTPRGRLDWRQLLDWLREDGWIGAEDAERVAARFRAGASSLHALVRLGAYGLPARKWLRMLRPYAGPQPA
jgi:general secretion pathway protein E